MNFVEYQNVTSSEGTTKLGVCTNGGETFKCVEKVYDDHMFNKVVNVLEKFPDAIKELGPTMYLVDKETKTVYMEYIECDSLEKFLNEICIYTTGGRKKLSSLFEMIDIFMSRLKELDVCHGDLHTNNLMVGPDMNIRMIDIDTIECIRDQKPGWCDDNSMLGSTMFYALTRDLKKEKSAAMRDFKSIIDERYKKKIDDMLELVKTLGVDDSLLRYMR